MSFCLEDDVEINNFELIKEKLWDEYLRKYSQL